jgi:hypothetical protein
MRQLNFAVPTDDVDRSLKAALSSALLPLLDDEPALVAGGEIDGPAQRALEAVVSAAQFLDLINSDAVSCTTPQTALGRRLRLRTQREDQSNCASPPISDPYVGLALVPSLPDCRAA